MTKPFYVNGCPIADVERVEGRVKDLAHRSGLSDLTLESSDELGQFAVMNGEHTIGTANLLDTIEDTIDFAIDVIDAVMVEGLADDEAPF